MPQEPARLSGVASRIRHQLFSHNLGFITNAVSSTIRLHRVEGRTDRNDAIRFPQTQLHEESNIRAKGDVPLIEYYINTIRNESFGQSQYPAVMNGFCRVG